MFEENKLEDDGLTPGERAADAKMVAAGLDAPYATIAAKKKGNRKRVDRRFKVNALDAVASPTANSEEVWDSPTPVFDEVRRIAQLVGPYLVRGAAVDTFRSDISKAEVILKVFDGRPQTTANLLKLYNFMQTRHPNGMRCLVSSPLFALVEQILVNEKAIQQPPAEKLSVDFGDVFAGIPSVVGEAKI